MIERAASNQTLRSGATFAAIADLVGQSMEDRGAFVWEDIRGLLEERDFGDAAALRTDVMSFLDKELKLPGYKRALEELSAPATPGAPQLSHAEEELERRRGSFMEQVELEMDSMIHERARRLAKRKNEEDPRVKAVLLESEQEELLDVFVEASRRVPSDEREAFVVGEMEQGPAIIHHPGLQKSHGTCHMGDVEILIAQRLLQPVGRSKGIVRFDVAPLGFRYYAHIRGRQGQSLEEVQKTITSYLDRPSFQRSYRQAYAKWTDAAALLWSSEPEAQLTSIGHLCREATQEFAEALAKRHGVHADKKQKSKTVARVKAVLDKVSGGLGDTEREFLQALLSYWRRLSDLVARQEHDLQKEDGTLLWEDARRVVFQTAVVMFEIDRALERCVGPKSDEDA